MKNFIPAVLLIGLTSSALLHSCSSDQMAKMPPKKVPVILANAQDVPIYNEFVAQTYGLKDIPIRARVDGYVEDIAFAEGSQVKRGQLLYAIDPAPYMAEVAAHESKVAEAQTIMVNAETDLNRYKPLAAEKAVSQSDLDAAQAKFDASVANLKAANANLDQAKIQLGYCSIKSPIDGLIGKTEARVGEYVGREPNPVILNTVSRIDTIRVQFSISEGKYLELAKAYSSNKTTDEVKQDVEDGRNDTKVQLILADGSIYDELGQIDFVDNQINRNTGSLLIQASFPNPSRLLRPGLYAKARLMLKTEEAAIMVPQRCLIELQGQYSVFVVNDSNVVESRAVQVSNKIGDMSIISSGLKDQEKVVIDAIQLVRNGDVVVPEPTEFNSKTTIEE